MSNIWLKFRVWTKIITFAAMLIYGAIFIWKNSSKEVQPWFFYNTEPETSVLRLVAGAFFAGVIAAVLVRTTFRTIRQLRELRQRSQSEKLQREVADMRTKASMLRSRTDSSTPAAEGDLPA